MNEPIRAIETSYKGYKFRSRTEARWAIFFDACEIGWKYEHEGYDLGELGFYLPDFWLPKAKIFAEVKGQDFTAKEINLCRRLALKSGHRVILLPGAPEVRGYFIELPTGLVECRGFLQPEDQDVVAGAVAQARYARFEHGETPTNVVPLESQGSRISPAARARRGDRRVHSTERGASAEHELIRAILLNRSRIEQVAAKLGEESIRDPQYRAIYRAVLAVGTTATIEEVVSGLDDVAVRIVEDILAEGANQIDPERTLSDSFATLKARDLDRRAAELDRIIPLLESGAEKDKLIEEKESIRTELRETGKNYFKKFKRTGAR